MADGYHVRVYGNAEGDREVRVERRNDDQSIDTMLTIPVSDEAEQTRVRDELLALLSEILETDPQALHED